MENAEIGFSERTLVCIYVFLVFEECMPCLPNSGSYEVFLLKNLEIIFFIRNLKKL